MRWITDLLLSVFESLFGCRHSNLSRPFTIEGETYKVCMDCSGQVFYSPVTMKQLSAREVRQMRHEHASASVAVRPATAQAREAATRRSNKIA